MNKQQVVIVGAGIAGLAAAVALRHTRPDFYKIQIIEQAPAFEDVGAGIQISPNAAKVLFELGLRDQLEALACRPQSLTLLDWRGEGVAPSVLADMSYADFETRYGAANYTIHRADLHAMLLQAALDAGCEVVTGKPMTVAALQALREQDKERVPQTLILGCDGLHSVVREWMLEDAKEGGAATHTGHVAWRLMLPIDEVPAHISRVDTTAWLAPKAHGVGYPVRGGKLYNFVWVEEGLGEGESAQANWSQIPITSRYAASQAIRVGCSERSESSPDPNGLGGLKMTPWRLFTRPPLAAHDYIRDHAALLGDAAHPMLPYLAQGGAMALEDSWGLACSLNVSRGNIPSRLQAYADLRAKRNARVVNHSARNGRIFHATGLMKLGRDLALKTLGLRVMNLSWLYRH